MERLGFLFFFFILFGRGRGKGGESFFFFPKNFLHKKKNWIESEALIYCILLLLFSLAFKTHLRLKSKKEKMISNSL